VAWRGELQQVGGLDFGGDTNHAQQLASYNTLLETRRLVLFVQVKNSLGNLDKRIPGYEVDDRVLIRG